MLQYDAKNKYGNRLDSMLPILRIHKKNSIGIISCIALKAGFHFIRAGRLVENSGMYRKVKEVPFSARTGIITAMIHRR
jgi:hypothetical protein